jgi:hypothetical protein
MGPYSHFVIANLMKDKISIVDSPEFYWGSIAPDIRHFVTGMQRSQTHLSPLIIRESINLYPQLKGFLLGYLFHCLSDEINILQVLKKKIPYKYQKNRLSNRQATVTLEFFNILRVKPTKEPISGTNNAFLKSIGVSDKDVIRYTREINRYIQFPTIRSALAFYQTLGFASIDEVERIKLAASLFQSNWLHRNMIMFGLQIGKVNSEITSSILSLYESIKIPD